MALAMREAALAKNNMDKVMLLYRRVYLFVLCGVVLSIVGCCNLKTEPGTYTWAKQKNNICAWEYYLRQYPRGRHADEARKHIVAAQPQQEPWSQIAQGMIDLDDIDMVYYDPADGQLRFVGSHSGRLPPLVFDDLVECLEVLGQGHDIGVSIEPKAGIKTDTLRPGEAMAVRHIPEATRDTHLGNTLFEIDRRLKTISLGVDNLTGAAVPCGIPGFLDLPTRVRLSGHAGATGHFGLLWFEPEPPEVAIDGYKLSFRQLKMRLISEGKHPSLQEFSDHLTEHFDEYAKENVVFAELRRIHKLVVVARWLQDAGFPLGGIRSCPRLTVRTPRDTKSMLVIYRTETTESYPYIYTHRYGLVGGVNLSPPTRYYVPVATPSGKTLLPGIYVAPQGYVGTSQFNPLPTYQTLVSQMPELPNECLAASAARPSACTYYWNVALGGQDKRVVAVPLTIQEPVLADALTQRNRTTENVPAIRIGHSTKGDK